MKDKIVYEIESLNIEDLDLEELENRMELAAANLTDLAWIVDPCDCNAYCPVVCTCYGYTCDTLCVDCIDRPLPV